MAGRGAGGVLGKTTAEVSIVLLYEQPLAGGWVVYSDSEREASFCADATTDVVCCNAGWSLKEGVYCRFRCQINRTC